MTFFKRANAQGGWDIVDDTTGLILIKMSASRVDLLVDVLNKRKPK